MKVLLTTDWYKPVINGVVASVLNLTESLTAMGHEVKILTLSKNRRTYTEDNVIYIGSLNAGKIYPNARIRVKLGTREIHELIEWCPDVIHSQCEFSSFLMAKHIANACKCPLVHTYHTVYEEFTHYYCPNKKLGKMMAATFSKKLLNSTQVVIAPTDKIRRMLVDYGVRVPIEVVPTGLKLKQFQDPMDLTLRGQMRAKYGIAEDDKVLLFLGRLAKEKNIGELLKLFKQENDPKLKLLIVGGGPYRAKVEAQVEELGLTESVIFTGMVNPQETLSYYRMGDIFVSASQSETQGLTYIEAMATGLPLLCREDACLEEVVDHGVNGFTFNSEESFHENLKVLLEEGKAREMGDAAAKKAAEKYSEERFGENALAAYRTVVVEWE